MSIRDNSLEGQRNRRELVKKAMGGPIKSRTPADCMVCCLAMLLKVPYEAAALFFPPIAVKHDGYTFELLMPYLKSFGIHLEIQEGGKYSYSVPHILSVPSKFSSVYSHVVFLVSDNYIVDPNDGFVTKYDGPVEQSVYLRRINKGTIKLINQLSGNTYSNNGHIQVR